jgi:hypothetical protein
VGFAVQSAAKTYKCNRLLGNIFDEAARDLAGPGVLSYNKPGG